MLPPHNNEIKGKPFYSTLGTPEIKSDSTYNVLSDYSEKSLTNSPNAVTDIESLLHKRHHVEVHSFNDTKDSPKIHSSTHLDSNDESLSQNDQSSKDAQHKLDSSNQLWNTVLAWVSMILAIFACSSIGKFVLLFILCHV